MPSPLIVTGEHPVVLDGMLDSSSTLQLAHGSDVLSDYGQTLHAKHSNLPSGTLRFELKDFSVSSTHWTITASHESNGNTVSWSRGSDRAYADFGVMTDPLEVEVTATSDASPPQTKTRRVFLKSTPVDGQGD
jgi:hypothetical protein